MDIDEVKKRKIEETPEPEKIDLDLVLKTSIESTQNIAKIISVLTQKIHALEKVFNKDLFNKD